MDRVVRLRIPPSSAGEPGISDRDSEVGVGEFEVEGADNSGIVLGGVVLEVGASLMRSLPFRTIKDDGIESDEIPLTLVGGGEV